MSKIPTRIATQQDSVHGLVVDLRIDLMNLPRAYEAALEASKLRQLRSCHLDIPLPQRES